MCAQAMPLSAELSADLQYVRRTMGCDRGIETVIYHSADSGSDFDIPHPLDEVETPVEVSSPGRRLRQNGPFNYVDPTADGESDWWNEPLVINSKSRASNKRKSTQQRKSPSKKRNVQMRTIDGTDLGASIAFIRDQPRPVLDSGVFR